MRRRDFLRSSILVPVGALRLASPGTQAQTPTRKILIAGGNYGTPFIHYMATLTGKKRPKLLYLPTASADGPSGIIAWYKSCAPVDVYPLVQESFIASSRQSQSWEEVLLSVDGIVASGGNTLNQQAIWKAQGVDVVLRHAWDRGSCSAAPAPDRCAGSKKARPTHARNSSQRSNALGFSKAAIARIMIANRIAGLSIRSSLPRAR